MSNLSEIQVDGAALSHNLAALKGIIRSKAKVAAVVKGNAYGHGLREVVQALDGHVDYFQVDDIDELRALRTLTSSPALVLGYVPLGNIREALELRAEIAIYDLERLDAIQEASAELGRAAKVHLKIDALLGRQGVLPTEVDCVLAALKDCPDIDVVAAYAHFANIEDTTDETHLLAQVAVFEDCLAKVRAAYPGVGRHFSATSGLMTYEQSGVENDLVRLGIGLYGLYPSEPLALAFQALGLKPAMRWVSHLAQVKTLPLGHPVSYGLTYITPCSMRVGVVPQGYSDGFDRGLSNVGHVLVGGKRCAVLGRVAMNMFVVDLSSVPEAKAEDEVVLLGAQGSERITAEEMADHLRTINYEITTRVSPLLPRVSHG